MLRIATLSTVFIIGTMLTQVGGVIVVGGWLFFRHRVLRRVDRPVRWSVLATALLYAAASFLLVPLAAKPFGRTALPLRASATSPIAPRSIAYCLLNRHYVSTDLATILSDSARRLATEFPGTTVRYLDASFPFFGGFPLFPHLSHTDGRKVDLTFLYRQASDPAAYRQSPSPVGYGIYEAPAKDEPAPYAGQSCLLRWDFDFLQGYRRDRVLDVHRTRELLRIPLDHPRTDKILLELHLRGRFGLAAHPRLRFQQCNAARHDDHIHYEIR